MTSSLRARSSRRRSRRQCARSAGSCSLRADLEEVYHCYNGFVTKRDADGNSISSISAPQVQAHMLEQAEIVVGMRILEIGSGGYNAALLAELVGPAGHVTTVDINKDVTDRASRLLAEAGYSQVNVVLADAEDGVPEHAPYDRILVIVGAWDIPPAWWTSWPKVVGYWCLCR